MTVTDELQRASAKVRIGDRRVRPALPPTRPRLAPHNHIRVRHSGRFHSYITLGCQVVIFSGFSRSTRAFLRGVANMAQPVAFAVRLFLSGGWAGIVTAPRFRLSPPRRVITPYLLLPFGRLGGFATCRFRGNRRICRASGSPAAHRYENAERSRNISLCFRQAIENNTGIGFHFANCTIPTCLQVKTRSRPRRSVVLLICGPSERQLFLVERPLAPRPSGQAFVSSPLFGLNA